MMDKDELYLLALSRFGLTGQINMVFEKFAELQKELCKFLRGKRDMIHIGEEIADCEIMLDQMKFFFKNSDYVEEVKKKKLKRLEFRLTPRTKGEAPMTDEILYDDEVMGRNK